MGYKTLGERLINRFDIRTSHLVLPGLLWCDEAYPTVEITIDDQPLQGRDLIAVSTQNLVRDRNDLIEGGHSKPSRCALPIRLRMVSAPA
ncbi:hypothetical protein C667_04890 [Thauera phenylacetica B4P]|uniref:Uncharacterized protein n=1 Tax=Thauera phenylacetica B4P TaxID=1234382 RepID=N6Z2S9_9RHOO|nr:hypothetical protein C667_04890 [Thauera phenylacetica B4P]